MVPTISFSQFKKMLARDIKESKSFAVTSDGEFAFIVVVPQTDYIEQSTRELCILSNAQGGKEPE